MRSSRTSSIRRWFPIVSVVFGLFVVFQLSLFSWLILRSLSQREVDRILVTAREGATELAQELAEAAESRGEDLVTAVAVSRTTRTFLDSTLLQQDIVEELEVTDSDGIVVFRTQARATIPELPQGPVELVPGELPSGQLRQEQTTTTYEIEERIGDLGFLHIRFDQVEMERRMDDLRDDLVRRSVLIGAATLIMLLTAYAGVWLLLRRAQRLEEQTARAERMAYVGTLAAGLAHEIRNPLNSLNLNMQMLEEELEGGEGSARASRRLLAITRSEIERLGALATDFLSFSRNRPLEASVLRANQLLEEAAGVMGHELEAAGATLEVRDESAGATVSVDPDQLRQLLLNLIKNALVASGEQEAAPRIELVSRTVGGKVALEVTDNGRGMTSAEQEKMFELFYSTRKGGTGLGLAIVERIAQAHGGTLEVDSLPGHGTTVRLWLPKVGVLPDPGEEPSSSP